MRSVGSLRELYKSGGRHNSVAVPGDRTRTVRAATTVKNARPWHEIRWNVVIFRVNFRNIFFFVLFPYHVNGSRNGVQNVSVQIVVVCRGRDDTRVYDYGTGTRYRNIAAIVFPSRRTPVAGFFFFFNISYVYVFFYDFFFFPVRSVFFFLRVRGRPVVDGRSVGGFGCRETACGT